MESRQSESVQSLAQQSLTQQGSTQPSLMRLNLMRPNLTQPSPIRWEGRISREEVEQILVSVLSDYIVSQAAARLKAEKKKAVILFTGSLAGFEAIPDMLKTLTDRGWELKAAFSKGAEALLPAERLRQVLPEHSIFPAEDIKELRRLIDERPFLLLPALTVNTAAKIANCIADEPVSNGVAYAIGRGKQILACLDGCCPDRKAKLPGGFHAPEAYREKMNQNLTALARYGIWLTDMENLPDQAEGRFEKFIQKNGLEAGHPQGADVCGTASAETAVMERRPRSWAEGAAEQRALAAAVNDLRGVRVIGKEDVIRCGPGTRLLAAGEAVITQVAADEIERRGIELIKG